MPVEAGNPDNNRSLGTVDRRASCLLHRGWWRPCRPLPAKAPPTPQRGPSHGPAVAQHRRQLLHKICDDPRETTGIGGAGSSHLNVTPQPKRHGDERERKRLVVERAEAIVPNLVTDVSE